MDQSKPSSGKLTLTPRSERTYIHSGCGQATTISGFDFHRVANPFFMVMGSTVCVQCGPIPLSEVRWEDTGETLADYRRRIRRRIIWVWAFWPLMMAAGAYAGWNYGVNNNPNRPEMIWAGAGGGAAAGLILGYFIVPLVSLIALMRNPKHID